MIRDPRTAPIGGDYLSIDGVRWLVVRVDNDGTLVEYRVGPEFYRNMMDIEEWTAAMECATVLAHGAP